MAMAKIKNFIDTSLKTVSQPMLERTAAASLEPEIGLRIVYSPNEKSLRVTVLGARHLPQNFGFTRVNSYVVKVRDCLRGRCDAIGTPIAEQCLRRSGGRAITFDGRSKSPLLRVQLLSSVCARAEIIYEEESISMAFQIFIRISMRGSV